MRETPCRGGDETPPDGPWRIAEACILGVVGILPDERGDLARVEALAAGLRLIGVPVAEVLAIGASTNVLHAVEAGPGPPADLLLLGAGIDIDPVSALELRRVAASDPMIAGVSPRRNDAAATGVRAGDWRRFLPAVTYAPLGDLSCLYLKGSVLRDVGARHVGAPADWDAYAMAINAAGFRMVLANRAFYRPQGIPDEGAPSLSARARRLEAAFPGARAAVAAFLSGAPKVAENLLKGLAPDAAGRRTVAFDLTHVGARHSGTTALAVALIRRAAEAWTQDWRVMVVAPAATHAFHFGDAPAAPGRIDPSDATSCAAFIRVGQPFSWKELDAAVRRAPVLVFFMLDTIGFDCLRLAPDDLDALWRFTLAEADGLLFNSAFTQRQFERRFGAKAAQPRLASLHSLNLADYAGAGPGGADDGTLLVIGNAFAHKRVAETARLLAKAYPERTVAVLGLAAGAIGGVESYPSGALDAKALAALYGRAALVVYPSVYEGFGFPVLEALAHRRPVLVRGLPPFAEIMAGTPEAANIHVFQDDADLLALVAAAPCWTDARGTTAARGWTDALADLRRILDEAVAGLDHDRVLRRIDFLRGRLAFVRHKPFVRDEPDSDDLDRLSALAGRWAAKAVRGLAALPGGRATLGLFLRPWRGEAGS